MKFEEFKRKLVERSDKDKFFTGDYLLKVNNNLVDCWEVMINSDKDSVIRIYYSDSYLCNDTINRFDLDGTDYKIEWFVLEK